MERIVTNIPPTKTYIGSVCNFLETIGITQYSISEEQKDTIDEFNGLHYTSVMCIEMPPEIALMFRLQYPDEDIMEHIQEHIKKMSRRERKKRPRGGWLSI